MTRRSRWGTTGARTGRCPSRRLWRRSRGDNPGGGIASSAADVLRWARFHLGYIRVGVGTGEVLRRMQGADGRAAGQQPRRRHRHRLVPARHRRRARRRARRVGQRAVRRAAPRAAMRSSQSVALGTQGPDGSPFNQEVVRWALRNYLGITERDPEPLPFDEARAREVAGSYQNEVMTFTIGIARGGLMLQVRSSRRSRRRRTRSRRRAPRRRRRPAARATSTSSPTASTRASAASSAAPRRRVTGVDLAGRLATGSRALGSRPRAMPSQACAGDISHGACGRTSPVSSSDLRLASTAGHPCEMPLSISWLGRFS